MHWVHDYIFAFSKLAEFKALYYKKVHTLFALSSLALHWNETAGDIERTLADEDLAFQQTNNNSSKNNSNSSTYQKEITLPSRLIYYVNRDSESPYHVLDTKTRHQQKHNKVRLFKKVHK